MKINLSKQAVSDAKKFAELNRQYNLLPQGNKTGTQGRTILKRMTALAYSVASQVNRSAWAIAQAQSKKNPPE